VRSDQSLAVVSQVLGVASQTPHSWLKSEAGGVLKGTVARPVRLVFSHTCLLLQHLPDLTILTFYLQFLVWPRHRYT